MSSSPDHAFVAWLETELAQRRWSYNQLARRAGISHSMLSRVRAGAIPSWSACHAIAGAFDLPPEQVFRQAGLLEPIPNEQAEYEELRRLLSQLSAEDRQELLEIARLKLNLDRENPGG
jgi:transcriptional regulator with XRE-family HTH domain